MPRLMLQEQLLLQLTTADYGESNYNYDIGFRSAEPPKPAGTASIGDFV